MKDTVGALLVTVWPVADGRGGFWWEITSHDRTGGVAMSLESPDLYRDPRIALIAGVARANEIEDAEALAERRGLHVMRPVSVHPFPDNGDEEYEAWAAFAEDGLAELFVTKQAAEAWWGAPL